MACFVKLWSSRGRVLSMVIQYARQAELKSESEYKAAVKIQSWFRGCRLRAYLAHLCASAVVIQRHYRGYRGRAIYRRLLKERLDEMRENYYQFMAAKIQSQWRGYRVRRHVFNYRAYKNYMVALQQKNEIVRVHLKEEWEKANAERLKRAQQLHELQVQERARRHHYMLSTVVRDGVFKQGDKSAFEDQMRAIKLAPLCIPKIKTVKQEDLSHDHHWRDHLRQFHQIHSRFCCSGEPPPPLASSKEGASSEMESSVNLPPLIKVQGPFKDPEKVWRQKVKPLESTLRVATLYNSVEIARAKLKAEEWRKIVIDEPFAAPYHQGTEPYKSFLNSSLPYTGSITGNNIHLYRKTKSHENVPEEPFRTIISPIPLFDRLNLTY